MVEEDRQCPTEPYHLCLDCYRRLHARSLRPREWYNLAAIHGVWTYHLHYDFYDEDGVALQPEEEVIDGWEHPAPDLRQARDNPAALLDYCITRQLLMPDSPAVQEWRRFNADETLACLADRLAHTGNTHAISIVLQLSAFVLRERARNLVLDLWWRYDIEASLGDLALASACCLDRDDGLARVVNAVEAVPPGKRFGVIHNLSHFRSAWVLNWIESTIAPPITDAWGALAIQSEMDWGRICAWLDRGRPLSLVSIDALKAFVDIHVGKRRTALLEPVALVGLPDGASTARVIRDYMRKDAVPRVEQRAQYVLDNIDLLYRVTPGRS